MQSPLRRPEVTRTRFLLLVLPAFTGVLLAQAQPRNAARVEFIAISAGEFMMGCSDDDADCNPDERPRHRVRITRPFELGKYEVTQAQWLAVMPNNPSANKGDNRPVENVSKFEALDFIAALNAKNDGSRYRLPTEAEWEYAARAGSSAPHAASLEQVAWFDANSDDESHPVGQKSPNAWGLYDMQGNVREWVSDLYSETFYSASPAADPSGPAPCANGFVDPATVGRGFPVGTPGGPPPGIAGAVGPAPRGAGASPPNGNPSENLQQQLDELRRQVQDLQQQVQQLRSELQAGPRGGGRGPGGPGGPPGPGGPVGRGGRGLNGPSVCIERPDGRGGQFQVVDPLDGLPTGLPVARGGGWDQSRPYLRLSARFTYYGPTLRLSDIGFRVVREPLKPSP